MRTPDHIKLRYIMLNHFEKGWTAAQSFRDLTNTYGEGTIGESTVRTWFARFKSGERTKKDVEGKEERGRPSELDDYALLGAVEQDESYTTRMLEEEFEVDHSTIVRHLLQLGKVCRFHQISLINNCL